MSLNHSKSRDITFFYVNQKSGIICALNVDKHCKASENNSKNRISVFPKTLRIHFSDILFKEYKTHLKKCITITIRKKWEVKPLRNIFYLF